MSTRATIKIEGINFAKLYKHYDGDPDCTLQWLKDFNERFYNERGSDPSYKFAQLLRHSSLYADKYGLDANEFTGWGIVPFDYDDFNYEYTLQNDGQVTWVYFFNDLIYSQWKDKISFYRSLVNARKEYDFTTINETIENVMAHLEIDKSVLNDPQYEFGYELKASIVRLMDAIDDALIIEIAYRIVNYIFNAKDKLELNGNIIKYDYEDVKEFGNEVER